MRNPVVIGTFAALAVALASCTYSPPSASPSASESPTPTASASASAPVSTEPSASASPSVSPTPTTMVVTVYFGNNILNPQSVDCGQVYGVHRTVPGSEDRVTAALKQVLAGPTAEESALGYTSWFSSATANVLIGAKVTGNTTYVNLTDLRQIIPNASTSCGSAALLAQLGTTASQAAMTPRVLYAINGQPTPFWEWLQMGCDATNDNCNPAPFQG